MHYLWYALRTAATMTDCYRVAVPLYLWPGYGSHPCAWERLLLSPDRNPLVVVNPSSGPGTEPFDLFKTAVRKCQAAGIKVIGYVRSIYSQRPLPEVLKDMQLYKSWYNVDGWFIDEMFHWDTSQVDYYKQIRTEATKLLDVKPVVVLNPGCASWPEAYMEAADIFVTYEQAAASYHEFRPAAFMMHYPKTMFWHMIYAARADTSDATLQRFKQQHAGWLYLTDLDLDNPYKDLPQEAIWQLQVDQSFSAAGHSQPHVAAGQSHGAAGQDQDVPGGLYQRLHCIWQTQLDSVKLHLARLSPA